MMACVWFNLGIRGRGRLARLLLLVVVDDYILCSVLDESIHWFHVVFCHMVWFLEMRVLEKLGPLLTDSRYIAPGCVSRV